MHPTIQGRLQCGEGKASDFTQIPWVVEQLRAQLGVVPYPGTLNLQLDSASIEPWQAVCADRRYRLVPPDPAFCDSYCYPVRVAGRVPAVAIVPEVPGYPADKLELIAALPLRETLALAEGATVSIAPWRAPAIETVIFDVDGTLVDTMQAFLDVARLAAEPHGLSVTPAQITASLTGEQPDFWGAVVPDDWPDRDHFKRQLHETAMAGWPDALARSATLIDGCADLLRQLAAAGIKLGIVTGNRRGSFEPLEAQGLMTLFGAVITSEHVAEKKPHPEGLQQCLRALDAAPETAVYVGDTAIDVAASQRAGMWSLGVLCGAADAAALSRAGTHRLAPTPAALVDAFAIVV